MRSDRAPLFEVCEPCPGHLHPPGTRVVEGLGLTAYLADPAARVAMQVRLSREWLHLHGPRPDVMTFHVCPATEPWATEEYRPVALSARPFWAE